MRAKRIEITVETDRILVIQGENHLTPAWCATCAGQVQMLTAQDAAAAAGLSLRALCRQVDEGRLHFSETPDGRLFICLNSLFDGPAADTQMTEWRVSRRSFPG